MNVSSDPPAAVLMRAVRVALRTLPRVDPGDLHDDELDVLRVVARKLTAFTRLGDTA